MNLPWHSLYYEENTYSVTGVSVRSVFAQTGVWEEYLMMRDKKARNGEKRVERPLHRVMVGSGGC